MMSWRSSAWLLMGTVAGLVSTGCPLTDKYYVEQALGGALNATAGRSSVSQGGTGNSSVAVGAAAGTAEGDSNTVASGAAGSEAVAGTAGASAVSCDAVSCLGTCCTDGCVDLTRDAANCGQCGHACPSGRHCRSGTCYGWTTMAAAPQTLVAREKAAYAVFGSKLFIFGGLDAQGNALNSGALYDKATDSWSMLAASTYTPSARQLASAIFTGQRVHVVGGRDSGTAAALDEVSRYDPTTGWLMTSAMAASRVAPLLAAGTNYLLVWGGLSATGAAVSGGERCNYGGTTVASCAALTSGGLYGGTSTLPERATDAAWASTATDALLFGGKLNGTTTTNKGYLFTFGSGTFSSLATGLRARYGALATSDGSAYFVWGGRDDTAAMSDGARYASGWTDMNTSGAPSPRWAPHRDTGWAFALGKNSIAIIGGLDFAGNPMSDGGCYDNVSEAWTPIEPWLSSEAHEWGVAALIEGEIFVWGGRTGQAVTANGERYLP